MTAEVSTRFTQGAFALATKRKEATRASIIIVNYNGDELLLQCLRSILQACGGNDEIILVDNGSTSGCINQVEAEFPEVRVIWSPINLGFGAGNNLGVQFANGKYLAFINPDVITEPGWLEALIAALEADPRAGLATPKILLLDNPKQINTCGNNVHWSGLALCRGMGMDSHTFPEAAEVNAVSGAVFVIREELFHRLGGFDEGFFLYMEDTDLSLRAKLAGFRCIYVPTAIAYHQYSLRFGTQKIFYQEFNRYQMLLKILKWRTLFVLLPTFLLAEVVTWGFVILKERNHLASKLKAYVGMMHAWSKIMEQRRKAQALRSIDDRDLIESCAYKLDFEQTSSGVTARLAHIVFDPIFYLFGQMALMVIKW